MSRIKFIKKEHSPHPANIGRFESSFQESANFKTPESFENSERKLQSRNSTIGDGRRSLCGHNAVDCSYCQLFFRAEKRAATNSREQRLQQLLRRILSCDPRESAKPKVQLPPAKGTAKEEEDFLTPMLLSTAYFDQKPKHSSDQAHLRQMHESCDRFNTSKSVIDSPEPRARSYFRASLEQVRTEELLTEQFHVLQTEQLHLQQSEQLRASSQFLLSMLAENLALNLSDVDFTNMTLKLSRRRMSYTKTFVKAVNAAEDSLLRSSTLETDAVARELRAEPKRLRPILNFV
nr:PREDICTED: uncharacterized protein LOC109042395 [Bemisia tabaci]